MGRGPGYLQDAGREFVCLKVRLCGSRVPRFNNYFSYPTVRTESQNRPEPATTLICDDGRALLLESNRRGERVKRSLWPVRLAANHRWCTARVTLVGSFIALLFS